MRFSLGFALSGAFLGTAALAGDLERRQAQDTGVLSAPVAGATTAAPPVITTLPDVTTTPSDDGGTITDTGSGGGSNSGGGSGQDVTVTETVTVTGGGGGGDGGVATVTKLTTGTTVTSTVILTKTSLSTTTVTSSDGDTATKTEYVTVTVSTAPAQKRHFLHVRTAANQPANVAARATAAVKLPGGSFLEIPVRGGAAIKRAHLERRATITETVTVSAAASDAGATSTTTVLNSVTATKTTTSTTTEQSTITETDQANAKTTIVTTATLTVTVPSGSSDSGSDSGGGASSGDSSGGDNQNKSGLSTGGKAGIGAGIGVAALVLIAGLVFYLAKRRSRNANKSNRRDSFGLSEVPIGGSHETRSPTLPSVGPAPGGYDSTRTPNRGSSQHLGSGHQPSEMSKQEGYRGTAMGDGRAGYAKPATYGSAYAANDPRADTVTPPSRNHSQHTNNLTMVSAESRQERQERHDRQEMMDRQGGRSPGLSSGGVGGGRSPGGGEAVELAGGTGDVSAARHYNTTEIDSTPVPEARRGGPVYEMPTGNY